MILNRRSGILLPITALPSEYGIGTFGKAAYDFVDFLHASGETIWQILPLGPTGFGDSPYQSSSAFAGNLYLIDLQFLISEGLLLPQECNELDFGNDDRRVDYGKLFKYRKVLLKKAFFRFDKSTEEYLKYLDDDEIFNFALFQALKDYFEQAPWYLWPVEYRNHDEQVLSEFYKNNKESVDFYLFTQYLFFKQYFALKKYASTKGVEIFGDMPIYVSWDSADVWRHRNLFQLDPNGYPLAVAGVPPDAFSKTGQLWGNPLFKWDELKKVNYQWWNKRIEFAFKLYDILRIDHFRAFDRYYSIPYGALDAVRGKWIDGPKFDFFADKLAFNIIAEDLGVIDDGVKKLLSQTKYPGMKILLFAFNGDPDNPYLPSHYGKNSVVYTGTHDNLPLKAYLKSLNEDEYSIFLSLFKQECKQKNISLKNNSLKTLMEKFIELTFVSEANWAIIPMWDLLGLDEDCRFNFPSTQSDKNWSYRFNKSDFSKSLIRRLKILNKKYNR